MVTGVRRGKRNGSGGFTMVEILVVVTLLAILASLAAPSLRALLARRAVESAVTALASDYRLARSEAIKRSAHVTICRSPDGLQCSLALQPGSWHDGWLVITDANANRRLDGTDEILRAQPPLDNLESIKRYDDGPGFGNTVQSTVFGPNGVVTTGNETLLITADASVVGGTRLVVISRNGRLSASPINTPMPP